MAHEISYIDCAHNTFFLLKKHLTSGTELILIGWKIVPNEEHVQIDPRFASQPPQTNPCIRHNFSTQVFRKRAAQLHYVGPELRYIFWPPWPPKEVVPRAFWRLVSKSCDECKGSFARGCEAKRWSQWTCSSLGTIFQPMRINSVPYVKCFCNNKNVLRAQSMVWHSVRHPVFIYIYIYIYEYIPIINCPTQHLFIKICNQLHVAAMLSRSLVV